MNCNLGERSIIRHAEAAADAETSYTRSLGKDAVELVIVAVEGGGWRRAADVLERLGVPRIDVMDRRRTAQSRHSEKPA